MPLPGALSLFPFTKRPLLLEGAGPYKEGPDVCGSRFGS
jgi:hypothetical protein